MVSFIHQQLMLTGRVKSWNTIGSIDIPPLKTVGYVIHVMFKRKCYCKTPCLGHWWYIGVSTLMMWLAHANTHSVKGLHIALFAFNYPRKHLLHLWPHILVLLCYLRWNTSAVYLNRSSCNIVIYHTLPELPSLHIWVETAFWTKVNFRGRRLLRHTDSSMPSLGVCCDLYVYWH